MNDILSFFKLLKPRVMLLVVFTGLVGLINAPGDMHPVIAIITIICISLGSGSAGAINMWVERDIDAKMARTKNRPIPSGKVNPDSAIEFAVIMALFSVIIMFLATNILAASLLLAAILFYVFIYTIWLKTRTPQNIVIGGAAGAFPPMIGWAAVTNSLSLEPILMFLIIFLWTPPHFWALALYRGKEYNDAGIPMMPVVKGDKHTKKQMLIYAVILFISTIVPIYYSLFNIVYDVAAVILGLYFIYLIYDLNKKYTEKKSKKIFGFSIIYLFLLFLLMMF